MENFSFGTRLPKILDSILAGLLCCAVLDLPASTFTNICYAWGFYILVQTFFPLPVILIAGGQLVKFSKKIIAKLPIFVDEISAVWNKDPI